MFVSIVFLTRSDHGDRVISYDYREVLLDKNHIKESMVDVSSSLTDLELKEITKTKTKAWRGAGDMMVDDNHLRRCLQ